jgi:hypothetical protein
MEVAMGTQAQKLAGKKSQKKGMKFEIKFASHIGGKKQKGQLMDIWGEIHTEPKTDVIGPDEELYSVKNSPGSTQIQVCSVKRFSRKFDVPQLVEDYLIRFCGAHEEVMAELPYNRQLFLEALRKRGINASKLSDEEIRRNRESGHSIEGFEEVVFPWIKANIGKITRFILQESFVSLQEAQAFPNKLVWNTGDSNPANCEIFDIDEIVRRMETMDMFVGFGTSAATSVRFGPFTFQMKGSKAEKENTSKSFHNMQFKCSLKNLKKYLKL